MNASELMIVKPKTEVSGALEYTERALRVVSDMCLSHSETVEPRSVYINKMLAGLMPWLNVSEEGKMTTRIQKYVKDNYGVKLPQKVISGIGNYLADEAPTGSTEYDITSRFNWRAGDFGDHGSCFFGSRTNVLRMLEEEGGLALRFWKGDRGIGRAWMLNSSEGPVVFNAYGPSLVQTQARLKLIAPDVPSCMVNLTTNGEWDGEFYINCGIGLLMGVDCRDFEMSVDFGLDGEEYNDDVVDCRECGYSYDEYDMYWVIDQYGDNVQVCHGCYRNYYRECFVTGEMCHIDIIEEREVATYMSRLRMARADNGTAIRYVRTDINHETCEKCGVIMAGNEAAVSSGGDPVRLCHHCAIELNRQCTQCQRYVVEGDDTCCCGCTEMRERA